MDKDHVPKLIALGSTSASIQKIQDLAAKEMKKNGLGYTLHKACAATLSMFLTHAGIDVPITLGAGKLATRLKNRHWKRIAVGGQIPGDVGVAYDTSSPPGADHVYLVIERIDNDKMKIADNQAPQPHLRYVSGHGKTPTEYFLRAPEDRLAADFAERPESIDPYDADFFPWDDEDTNSLEEPFQDDGTSAPR